MSLVRYQANLSSAVEVEQPQEEVEEPTYIEDVIQRRVMPERVNFYKNYPLILRKKYFDSADWVLSGQAPLPTQTYNGFAQPQSDQIVAKKILAHRANKVLLSNTTSLINRNSLILQIGRSETTCNACLQSLLC